MAITDGRVAELFADAQFRYYDALDLLARGRIRDAAGKAWEATRRATDGMALARTGQEPRSAGDAGRALLRLGSDGPAFKTFHEEYSIRSELLHTNCVYDGNCEPEAEMAALIRDTEAYIREARGLAEAAITG